MNCDQARELIHRSLEANLTRADETSLGEHLAACPRCEKYGRLFGALKSRLTLMGAEAGHHAFQSLLDRFLERLDSPSHAPVHLAASFSRRPPFTYAAAAAVLIALALFVAMAILAPSPLGASTIMEKHRLWETGQLILDTHLDCCHKLSDWFEKKARHPITVPDVKHEGVTVEGGKCFGHVSGREIFYVACRLEGKPVSLFVCEGPDVEMPEGEEITSNGEKAVLSMHDGCTMVSWFADEYTHVLVMPFPPERAKALFAAMD